MNKKVFRNFSRFGLLLSMFFSGILSYLTYNVNQGETPSFFGPTIVEGVACGVIITCNGGAGSSSSTATASSSATATATASSSSTGSATGSSTGGIDGSSCY